MENIKNKINNSFIKFITKKNHFFSDIKRVISIVDKWDNEKEDYKFVKYNKLLNIPEHIVEKDIEYKTLTIDKIQELDKEMRNMNNIKQLFQLISDIANYKLESVNVDKINDKNTVMIVGAGPIGLFVACYLRFYYGDDINIILYDNRIDKPGFRKPYTRQRIFVTNTAYLALVLPKLYCYENYNDIMVNIFVLEYLLYSQAVLKFNIPIIYEDYDWNDYKKIAKEKNAKVLFDCTGGRLKNVDLFQNINDKYLSKLIKIDKNIGKELNIDMVNNKITINEYPDKDIFKQHHYYGSITIVSKDNLYINKHDINIKNKKDLLYLNQFKRKKYTHSDTLSIINGIMDDTERSYLYHKLKKTVGNYYYKFDVWQLNIRHSINIADTFDKTLYIGAGDTIFHSHFITGAGLNRTISLAVKCCHYIEDLL